MGGDERTKSGRWMLLRTIAALALAATAFLGSAGSATALTPATSTSGCLAATQGATVHFQLGGLASASPAISGLTVNGFDAAACDGEPVVVTLSGNDAGDPAQAATKLLTTYDSELDPCTGSKLGAPLTISGGSITLNGCPGVADPDRAAFASVHDVTRLTVFVAGSQIPANPGGPVFIPDEPSSSSSPSASASPSAEPSDTTSPGSPVASPTVKGTEAFAPGNDDNDGGKVAGVEQSVGGLPFTGGPNAWLLYLGVFLVVFGIGSLLYDRSMLARKLVVAAIRRRRTRP